MSEQDYISPITANAVVDAGGNGNRIENRKPVEAALALELMAEGKTYDDVEAATGISYETLVSLRARHPDTLDKRRKQLAYDGFEMAEGLRQLAKKKMQMLAEDEDQLMKVNLKDLVLPYAIAQDKGFAALEGNTVRIEHTSKKLSIEDARKLIEEARNQIQQGELNVTAEHVNETAQHVNVTTNEVTNGNEPNETKLS
jgi:hypothetical protein